MKCCLTAFVVLLKQRASSQCQSTRVRLVLTSGSTWVLSICSYSRTAAVIGWINALHRLKWGLVRHEQCIFSTGQWIPCAACRPWTRSSLYFQDLRHIVHVSSHTLPYGALWEGFMLSAVLLFFSLSWHKLAAEIFLHYCIMLFSTRVYWKWSAGLMHYCPVTPPFPTAAREPAVTCGFSQARGQQCRKD